MLFLAHFNQRAVVFKYFRCKLYQQEVLWTLLIESAQALRVNTSLLSRNRGVLLLCLIALLATAVPLLHSPLPPQLIGQNRGTGLVKVSTIPGRSIVRTISAQSTTHSPAIQGWGGVTLEETSSGQLQSTLSRLNQSGYNGVRIGFSATATQCSSGELGSWSQDWFNQTIQLAKQYNMWVILDYHSYGDLVNSTCQTQWLSFWSGVLSTDWHYDMIVWEPINEPAGSVAVLSAAYQAWITQARSLRDKHWIAVENTISNDGCNFDPQSLVNCYPVVTDPLNETFLSIHPYFFYDLWRGNSNTYGKCSPSSANTWGNATAECVANIYNEGMLEASSKYHMPILDTEGGAVYYSCNNVCASPPDAVGTDDASYSITTFHFIQYLTNLMQSENMGWLWWEAGEGSCCGALDTWGALLSFRPVSPPTPQPQPPPCQCNPSPGSWFAGIPVFWVSIGGIVGLVVTAVILFRRRISKDRLVGCTQQSKWHDHQVPKRRWSAITFFFVRW